MKEHLEKDNTVQVRVLYVHMYVCMYICIECFTSCHLIVHSELKIFFLTSSPSHITKTLSGQLQVAVVSKY
jgi:hypothetical protein